MPGPFFQKVVGILMCVCHVGSIILFEIYAVLVLLSRLLTSPVGVLILCFKLEGRTGVKNIEMANTGVLPFVRGVDFTSNDFSVSVS
jgi:hypothetical protein